MVGGKVLSTPLHTYAKLKQKDSRKLDGEKANMAKVPYASTIGSLMYAMVCTRPNITHDVGVINRFVSEPGKEHWNVVKWIMRYLRGTMDLRLCFGIDEPTLVGYTDADMAGDIDSRK